MPLMNCLDLLIPFGLPPAEHANDLVKLLTSECGTDGLAMLLSRYQSLERTQFDDFSPELPHEVWLNERFKAQHYSLLQHYANTLHVNLNPGHWFLLNPVHLHIARNHLVLTDYRQLNLSEADARVLFEKAKSLCDEAGVELVFGSATTWFLRVDNCADAWADLVTSSPDAACGHNIDIWSAKGTKELAWRKLQNEIQMEWFIHPIQQQREARGEKMINGLWLWAGTSLPAGFKVDPSSEFCRVGTSPTKALEDKLLCPPWLSDGGHKTMPILQVSDQLSSAALSDDWGTWAALMTELDRTCFKPLCAALKTRELHQVQIHLSNSKTLLSIQTSSNALRKFWCPPTFKNLMS